MPRLTLARRVTVFTTLGLGIVWAAAIALMAAVLWSEQEELFDQQLAETAQVLLPLLSHGQNLGLPAAPGRGGGLNLDEALIYRLYDSAGRILQQSPGTEGVILPAPGAGAPGTLASTDSYRVFTTAFTPEGYALQFAAPMAERKEAFREGMTGFLLPMIALLPLTWLFIGWICRRALAPLRELGLEIAARDGTRLAAIDASDWPADLVQIAGSFNGFMARLTQSLEAERTFATNAAHELRTPVAIALAQTQQLRMTTADPERLLQLETLERGLQRMRRIVARLLQLARADAGIGLSSAPQDIVRLARLVLDDVVPRNARARIHPELPQSAVTARIDPDAFAIILGNLVENALQHGEAGGPVHVTIRQDSPTLEVRNDGPAVGNLAELPRRFTRRGKDGFGIGLHICRQIAEQAGGALELVSPVPGRPDGFAARVTLPPA